MARLLIEPSATRDRLTAGMYLPTDEDDALGAIELALGGDARRRADRGAHARGAQGRALRALRRAPTAAPRARRGRHHQRRRAHAAAAAQASSPTQVIRVDDFAQDLGASELEPAAASAPASATSRTIAAA